WGSAARFLVRRGSSPLRADRERFCRGGRTSQSRRGAVDADRRDRRPGSGRRGRAAARCERTAVALRGLAARLHGCPRLNARLPPFCPARHAAIIHQTEGAAAEGGKTMKRSNDRILTTHAGSLSRPANLIEMNRARASGESKDDAAYAKC